MYLSTDIKHHLKHSLSTDIKYHLKHSIFRYTGLYLKVYVKIFMWNQVKQFRYRYSETSQLTIRFINFLRLGFVFDVFKFLTQLGEKWKKLIRFSLIRPTDTFRIWRIQSSCQLMSLLWGNIYPIQFSYVGEIDISETTFKSSYIRINDNLH